MIDALNGQISVSPGANLDPDLIPDTGFGSRNSKQKPHSYIVEVSALDGGLGEAQRLSLSVVNITILDVNNKPPYFERGFYSRPYHVTENAPTGFEIITIQAKDPDISANLQYSIDVNMSIAKNELGVVVPVKGIFCQYYNNILYNNIYYILIISTQCVILIL